VFAKPWIPDLSTPLAVCSERALPSIRIETPDLLRLRGESISATTRATSARPASRTAPRSISPISRSPPSRPPAPRAGAGDFMMDAAGRPLAAGDQHRSGHDRSQPGAMGGGARSMSTSTNSWARARDQFHRRPASSPQRAYSNMLGRPKPSQTLRAPPAPAGDHWRYSAWGGRAGGVAAAGSDGVVGVRSTHRDGGRGRGASSAWRRWTSSGS